MPRARRRGLRAVVVLLVLVLLTTGLAAVAAEVGVRRQTERVVNDQVSAALGGEVTTVVGDRIILASLARDRLDLVTGWSEDAVVSDGEQSVALEHVDFTARGVRGVRGSEPPVVDDLRATATLSWAEVARITGTELTPAADGRVEVRHQIEVWGATVPITVSARPGVDPRTRRLTLSDPTATLSGVAVPRTLLTPLLTQVTQRATLPDVLGMGYRDLRSTRSGVVVDLVGTDVELAP